MDDNLMVPISRQSAGSSQSQPKKETTYPTELIDLPSQGYFYPNEHPLSDGHIEMKLMTAKEEDILMIGVNRKPQDCHLVLSFH